MKKSTNPIRTITRTIKTTDNVVNLGSETENIYKLFSTKIKLFEKKTCVACIVIMT